MMRHIVVGVDGSSASREAARWAVDHARQTGAELEAVHAWSAPDLGTDRIAGAAASPDRLEREARRELREVIDQLDERGLVAPIAERVACGEPAAALLDACRTRTSSSSVASGSTATTADRTFGGSSARPRARWWWSRPERRRSQSRRSR